MSNHKKLQSCFGWVGGKTKLAKDIVGMLPAHKMYVEVFGGALSVLYAKEPSKLEVVNDINSELINLHRAIRNNPKTLSMFLHKLLISREIFNDIKTKKLRPRNNIERASFYFYLITQSFGAKGGNFAMSAKSGRKPKNIYKDFATWSKRLKGVTIENKSFIDLIKLYDKEDSLFYCDPPYVGTESYYQNTGGFGIEEHIRLRDSLKNIKGKFLLSYNDCEVVRDLYKDFIIEEGKEIRYTLGSNVHHREKRVREIFIKNY